MKVQVKVKLSYPNDMLQQRVNRTNSCASLFYYYTGESLDFIKRLDTSNVYSTTSMCENNWKLVDIPLFDTSNVRYASRMFGDCRELTIVPAYNFSNVVDMRSIFYGCGKLKSMLAYGMKVSFDISASTLFEASDLEVILNNLATVTTTQTLTMGATNLAKLTETQKAIATSKGWVLA